MGYSEGEIMIISAPATLLTAAVTLLAVLVTLGMAMMVSRVRTRVNIKPPAMTGSPDLDVALRIHGNTVEQFILFLPALWLAALYFQGWIPGILGLAWCVGRVLYAVGYSAEKPGGRAPGFFIAILATLALIVLAGIGIVQAWMAASAT
jgi:glutathione S-transferase